ncbi:YggS family pyridoxal phosphate-dependent enzyme [Tetragenococcus koreensis]|uniref:YggS family pyridoxal phosphate-dependent enzyme n=1 Tax=Tetragenococcus koreensis TaxID=290335 RepID=UPI001F2D7416|nr:YggS family pyridoxal phosphate-dependent enzyme [Tetragenococcus koreensis]MCF1584225.1 YggS family pyridoxal phosphate-dependent enzyme [Tetragenococcus koreensis]MCF1613841.1 YggS family pyridoxal phosphate-dependent enzyme [Tetragenococcus koreensis]MCF1619551.1 YggS family pyridoxal phosphate-dependent enzyme [Tetragenococcus koreensis]MCF1623559.1 YggS family pyridoxal phosphate-dependent enzyme [Tetragenococcus koreensis]MCF1628463.1 YggS family pyridoxal phosphate-dependent enzyme [
MISDNLREVQQEMQDSCALVSRSSEEITLIGVTKTVGINQTIELANQGVNHLAENRVDQFLSKKEKMSDFTDIAWHFIGNLQRRKVKSVINEIDFFHALDSLKLGNEIQKRADKTIRCFVEVNVSGEDSKQGIASEELETFIEQLALFNKIKVVGLMTMAPLGSTKEQQHEIFARLKHLQETIQEKKWEFAPCTQTSMGMSNDFPVAIQEGATFIRVGTALFKE